MLAKRDIPSLATSLGSLRTERVMSEKDKTSFGGTFLRSLLITAVIQIVGIILFSLYFGLLNAFPKLYKIIPLFLLRLLEPFGVIAVICIIAAAVNIVISLKSSFTAGKKAALIILMPTNLCYFLFIFTPLGRILDILPLMISYLFGGG